MVDPSTWLALIAGIALATFFLRSLSLLSNDFSDDEFVVRRHFVPRHFVPGHILSRDNMSPGQDVALCPHYFAVEMGDILSQETYCPGSVRRHFVPGDVLSKHLAGPVSPS